MTLFDQVERRELRPKRDNEPTFEYLNSSARPYVTAGRALIETWFTRLPENAQPDARGRYRSRDEAQHQSAFYELLWHELLTKSGYDVIIHPNLADVPTNPDFLAVRNGIPMFYVEVTLAMPPGNGAADRRLAELHDTLDRMESPDFFLEVQYRGTAQDNVRGRGIRERLERWLRGLSHADVSGLYANRLFNEVPSFTITESGITLTFSPIPKGEQHRGQIGVRPVAVMMPLGMHRVSTHEDIRTAIEGKASKYGNLQLPIVIAVNVLDDFFEQESVLAAVFGDEQVLAVQQPDGTWIERWDARAPNGAWRGRNGPRNTLVSAVAVTHALSIATLRTAPVAFIHNPWATNPLTPEMLAIPQCSIEVPEGKIVKRAGTLACDILGVAEPWPVNPEI